MKNYYNEYMARYPIIEMSYESFVSKITQIYKRKEIYSLEALMMGSEYQTEKFIEIWEKEAYEKDLSEIGPNYHAMGKAIWNSPLNKPNSNQ